MWQLKAAYVIPLVISATGMTANKLHESLKLLTLCPGLYSML
jgi:hypothetical protein